MSVAKRVRHNLHVLVKEAVEAAEALAKMLAIGGSERGHDGGALKGGDSRARRCASAIGLLSVARGSGVSGGVDVHLYLFVDGSPQWRFQEPHADTLDLFLRGRSRCISCYSKLYFTH